MGFFWLGRWAVRQPDWHRGGSDGSVYVADMDNHRIQKFSVGQ
ncbi:MAG: hypothetical protein CL696_00975 [Chloroflexi bacterium]|nr:hypothetical protein [Chloroflexota bacterium]MQG54627.1 hypothetical protein [SAR202 cluster bacterium]